MKTVASLLAGTALAVTILLGLVMVASAVIVPQQEDVPHFTGLDVADLWTMTPVRVDPEQQAYERLPPRYGSNVMIASTASQREPVEQKMAPVVENVDVMETGAVADADMDQVSPVLSQAHVSWCHTRYHSYSTDDDSYVSHRGELRTCVSPYLSDPIQDEGQAEAMLVQDETGSATPGVVNSAHAQNCLQRYRSYRAEDNSYQPYGGGPRRQCELRTF